MIIECAHCEAMVDAKVIGSYDYVAEDDPPGRYSFLKCPKCGMALLVIQEDYGGGLEDPFRIFPPYEDRLNFLIPRPIRDAYAEAWSCQRAKAFTAAAIMCRKTLEAICVEHKAVGRNLVASLKNLKDSGVIEDRLYEWADALRISGNEAAHDVGVTVSRDDARDLLDFTKALLEYVFTFRDKFEEFKKRRQVKEKAKKKVECRMAMKTAINNLRKEVGENNDCNKR